MSQTPDAEFFDDRNAFTCGKMLACLCLPGLSKKKPEEESGSKSRQPVAPEQDQPTEQKPPQVVAPTPLGRTSTAMLTPPPLSNTPRAAFVLLWCTHARGSAPRPRGQASYQELVLASCGVHARGSAPRDATDRGQASYQELVLASPRDLRFSGHATDRGHSHALRISPPRAPSSSLHLRAGASLQLVSLSCLLAGVFPRPSRARAPGQDGGGRLVAWWTAAASSRCTAVASSWRGAPAGR
jgi:hypothetical protein